MRIMFAADGLLPHLLFSDLDWTNHYRGVYISYFVAIMMLSAFFYELLNGAYRIPQFLIVLVFVCFTLLFLISDAKTFLLTTKYTDILGALVYIYLLFLLIKNAYRFNETSVLFIIVFFCILISTMILDSVLRQMINHKIYLAQIGLYIFVLSQTCILVFRFSSAFSKIETLSKAKDEILANTSHELKTPLNGILGTTENLLSSAKGKLREDLSLIAVSGKRLYNLVNDILDIENLKNRGISLDKQSLDFGVFIKNTIPLFQVELAKSRNKLEVEVTENTLVLADPDRLNQILYNLISNATKFTKNGKIKILTQEDNNSGKITICVSDTGIGIKEMEHNIIFDRFEKVSFDSQGLGLGLNIAKHLVEAHGGDIWVDAEINEGSKFYFTLPKSYDPPIPIVKSKNRLIETHISKIKKTSRSDRPTILVVDDDPVNIRTIESFISDEFNLISVQSGDEALENIDINKPHLVLLDIMMDGLNGIKVCQKIREKYDDVELPIIFQTARNDSVMFQNAFEYGGNDYITKPFTKTELLSRINKELKLTGSIEGIQQIFDEQSNTIYIETNVKKRNYVFLYSKNNKSFKKMVRLSLKKLCKHNKDFIQVKGSLAVNVNYIKSIEKTTRQKKTSYNFRLDVELEKKIDLYSTVTFNDNIEERLHHLIFHD